MEKILDALLDALFKLTDKYLALADQLEKKSCNNYPYCIDGILPPAEPHHHHHQDTSHGQ